jgi:hypothetical protein
VGRLKAWLGRRGKSAAQAVAGVAVTVLTAVGVYAPNFDRHDDVAFPDPLPEALTPYVALGDSYSAGEGLPEYFPGTGEPDYTSADRNRCHRSVESAYGAILGVTDGFRACSGALLGNMFGRQDGVPPQLGRQPEPDVKTVTITISGNDAGFSKIVTFCAIKLSCLDTLSWTPPDGGDERTIRAYATRRIRELDETLLPTFYTALRAHFPAARILVLGYPQLFAAGSDFAEQRFCQKAYRTFSQAERSGFRDLQRQYNGVIEQRARAAGLEYIEVADAFEGHETCGPKGPWLAFVKDAIRELESFSQSGGVDAGNFHPTASGQGMFARLVHCYLAINPNPPGGALPPHGNAGDAVYDCATTDLTEPPDAGV